MEQAGTSCNHLNRARTTWNKVEPPVTRWTQQLTDTKNKKFIGETVLQYLCSIEYNISNSYCHKEHHLTCLQVELPRTEWNQDAEKVRI